MKNQLRQYQQEAIRDLTASHEKFQRILLSLPTGTGKTFTAAKYVKDSYLDVGKTVLWIAHSEELLSQAYETFTDGLGMPDHSVARRFAGHEELEKKPNAKVWLVNNRGTQGPSDQPDFIVIDEAHHAAAGSYTDWLSLYFAYRKKGPKVLGLTATPYRLHEGKATPLEDFTFSKPKVKIFETTAFRRSFCELGAQGHLALFRHITFPTDLEYKMSLQGGEFNAESLGQLDNAKRNRMIAKYWQKNRGKFGKTLIFAGSQAHAKNLAKQFGDDANYVVSGDDDRKEVIAGFRNGQFPVLVNVGIFKEGVDVPDIRTVILARPTASPGLFTQMVGRGSRILPEKRFFYLVDIHDQLGKHERYLAGIDDLADRDKALIKTVERKARAMEKLDKLETREIADTAGALVDLLVTPVNDVLTHFGGWITFRDADDAPLPVGTLLSREEYAALEAIAGGTLTLHPRHVSRIPTASPPSYRLGKCVQALKDGLIGKLHCLDSAALKEFVVLRTEGAVSLGIKGVATLGALKQFNDSVQARGQKLGVAAKILGRIENEYAQTPRNFAGVAWLRNGTESYAKLLGRKALSVIAKAVERNASNELMFSDAPRILAEIEAAEPDLKGYAQALLDVIGSSKLLTDFLTLCPGVTP